MTKDRVIVVNFDLLDRIIEALPADCRFMDDRGDLLLWVPGNRLILRGVCSDHSN